MRSAEIREKYLNFFKARGHTIIPSASIVPENDPTLLFTNSGMSPLVPYLLGEKHPAGKRLVNSQKCFRAEDIEEIGDNRHNTFFEMLGNWSLGDYFKEEQLEWWYEFLIEEMKIDPSRLYATVYAGDDRIGKDETSISILKKIFKKYGIEAEEGPTTLGRGALGPGVELDFKKQRIFAYRDKNWWQRGDALGELGGPDSETFYDTGRPHQPKFGKYCHLNCDCGRFLEIGNSVFMQYQKTEDGWRELQNKNVDFGGGLERLAMVIQGKDNVFETDLFLPIIRRIEQLSGRRYKEETGAFEIIADHLKAATFIMADERGVVPSNTEQGYIVRRLIRRALRYGRQIGIKENLWTKQIAEEVKNIYQDVYPETAKNLKKVGEELDKEEEKFAKTLERGLKEFEKIADRKALSGKDAFNLYQTFGFPIELIKELALERGMTVDEEGFIAEIKKHQELSRTTSAGRFKGGLADTSEKTTRLHTATHLLLAALRKILGSHVVQRGSNITFERLRFDFAHPRKLSEEELRRVEDLVNQKIKEDLPVRFEEMSRTEAMRRGVVGVFPERYGEIVKVYIIGDGENIFSQELCGGPHVRHTGQIGRFKILKEEAVAAGIRRIRADVL